MNPWEYAELTITWPKGREGSVTWSHPDPTQSQYLGMHERGVLGLLNWAGAQGWELCHVEAIHSDVPEIVEWTMYRYVFKRAQ
jgi:hypothetical protein